MIQISVPFLPPSVNQCYATNFTTGRRFPTKALGDFKKAFKQVIRPSNSEINALQGKRLCLIIELWMHHERLYCKDGSIKKLDASNRCKPLEDAIADLIGIDDRFFFRVTVEKKETQLEEKCDITIMENH